MKLYAGIDLHSTNSVLVIINGEQKVIYQKRLGNDLGLVLQALEPYQTTLKGVVVESTYNWYWLVDGLHAAGYTVHLAHPAAMTQYAGLKSTDDRSDARWLALQLLLNILATGYIYPKEKRGLREVLRKRMKLVKQHTQSLLGLQSQITRYQGIRLTATAVKQLTQASVAEYLSDPYAQACANSQLRVMQAQAQEIAALERIALSTFKASRLFSVLKTVPGIGKVLAMVILAETGAISRFKSARHYSSYARCVESKRISNAKKKGENNRKNGNGYLAWALMEAANFAIRYDERIKRYYQRRLNKVHRVVALKSVANKLAKAIYFILKNQEEFDVTKAF